MTEHVLDLIGTGFFSSAKCTGCDWAMKGHADETRRVWSTYHADGNVTPIPGRVELPPVPENPVVAAIERRIIQLLAHRVDFDSKHGLYAALGHAEARAIVLDEPMSGASPFVSNMMARVASLSKRQREKLRHPSRNRAEMQRILEDG